MGCGVSRMDGNGMVLPAKLCPVFLYRLELIKMRRQARPLKDFDSTPSKKELLLHHHHHHHHHRPDAEHDHEKSCYLDKNAPNKIMPLSPKEKVNEGNAKASGKPKEENGVRENKIKADDEKDGLTGAEIDGSDRKHDEDDDNDERMIGHDNDDDGAIPGSPSFRVYFKDGEEDKHNDIIGPTIEEPDWSR